MIWEDRGRNVFYRNPADVEDESFLTHWPRDLPMPRPFSTIINLGGEEIIAEGYDDNGREYVDFLRKYEFSGAYHWIEKREDPENAVLFPHLNKQIDRSYLEDLEGPSDEELGRAA